MTFNQNTRIGERLEVSWNGIGLFLKTLQKCDSLCDRALRHHALTIKKRLAFFDTEMGGLRINQYSVLSIPGLLGSECKGIFANKSRQITGCPTPGLVYKPIDSIAVTKNGHRALGPACAPRGHGAAQVRDPEARGTEERHIGRPRAGWLPRPVRLVPLVPRGWVR